MKFVREVFVVVVYVMDRIGQKGLPESKSKEGSIPIQRRKPRKPRKPRKKKAKKAWD